ncbi:putative secreted protein with PEP-CTERM sorting signal [Pseudoduganella flava]|nr:FxDxF family PEP-CTERM protein [Pseudoduganella flava]TWI44823.1 putative secreted protein with PEP-CTERM sorting signal [Pseudoduganella flava]
MKKALLSKVAGSLLLSAGVLASGAASADTTLTFDAAGNAYFGATHAMDGAYDDVFLFSVDTDSFAQGTAVNGVTRINGDFLSNYGISNIQFFWQNGDTRTNLDTTFSSDGYITFSANNGLASGNYGFIVSGATALPGMGGSYAGNLNITPVPEPATYAMLGVGIGLLALTARRKTNNKLG